MLFGWFDDPLNAAVPGGVPDVFFMRLALKSRAMSSFMTLPAPGSALKIEASRSIIHEEPMSTLKITEIEEMARRALVKAGATQEAASSLAKAIAAAERDGIPSHGLAYLPTYCEHLACGKVVGSAVPRAEPGDARHHRDRCGLRLRASRDRQGFCGARAARAFARYRPLDDPQLL